MASKVVACPSCGTKNRLPLAASGHPRCPSCKTDLPWLVDAGDADFDAAVDTSALVVVDLWAPWCGPCRMIAPVLETLSREMAGRLKVVKVNVDHSPLVAQRYRAQSIPMLLIMDKGEVVDTLIGAQPAPMMRARIQGALDRRA
ncbi:MAG: thioredoxin [Dermatophilaceae bacterium]|nr:thioredoxin [Intrasporangiaceae bacterium]